LFVPKGSFSFKLIFFSEFGPYRSHSGKIRFEVEVSEGASFGMNTLTDERFWKLMLLVLLTGLDWKVD